MENWFLQIMIYNGQNHEQILEEEEVEKTRGQGIVFWSLHTQTVGSMKE